MSGSGQKDASTSGLGRKLCRAKCRCRHRGRVGVKVGKGGNMSWLSEELCRAMCLCRHWCWADFAGRPLINGRPTMTDQPVPSHTDNRWPIRPTNGPTICQPCVQPLLSHVSNHLTKHVSSRWLTIGQTTSKPLTCLWANHWPATRLRPDLDGLSAQRKSRREACGAMI